VALGTLRIDDFLATALRGLRSGHPDPQEGRNEEQ
jgi:hypothetical protein